MKWHPDKHEGDDKKIAEKKFYDIAAATEVLSDPGKVCALWQQVSKSFSNGFSGLGRSCESIFLSRLTNKTNKSFGGSQEI